MTDSNTPREFGWVLLELMGHRQRIGLAREEEVAGGLMLRIDVQTDEGDYATEYYGASSIYALRPISKDVANEHYAHRDPRPPRPLEYRDTPAIEAETDEDDDETFEDGEFYE